jgi:hypothetical protein
MISRAAGRTSSERPSAAPPSPAINPISRSPVRSDAAVPSIGAPLRWRPVAKLELV